jgi:hypothetical protein
VKDQNPNGDGRSNTAPKLQTAPGRPFAKGNDPRRNLKGRPRTFDQVRDEAQRIAHEILPDASLTVIQAILRTWAKSKEPMLQLKFVEYAFGKVPDKLETTGLEQKPVLILHYAHERNGAEKPQN